MALADSGGGPSRDAMMLWVRALNNIQQTIAGLAGTSLAVTTVGALPSAASAGQGAKRLVTDANATTFASIVAGGGTDIVPVYSDGTDWRIG